MAPDELPLAMRIDGQALEVFEHWVRVFNKNARSVFKGKRAANVRARLKDKYTVDQLKTAVEGCKLSPHHQGQNPEGTVYDDLELICRDPSKVDRFIAIATASAAPRGGAVVPFAARPAKVAAAAVSATFDDDDEPDLYAEAVRARAAQNQREIAKASGEKP
jgi:hypothetical protein